MKDKKLETFLKTLMLPKEELEGNSICPYLEKYASCVKYAHVKSVEEIIKNNPIIVEDMQNEEGSTFIYIIEWDISYNEIVNLRNIEQEKYNNKDIEILFLIKDDKSQPPLKVLKNYSYDQNSLLVLQRKSTLKKSRNELAKKTNYYNYWKKG